MKKIKSKIIISILIMALMMLISSISMGITINGTWHYTKEDIWFENNKIHVRNSDGSINTYWCTNHRRSLSRGMGKTDTFTKSFFESKSVQTGVGYIDSADDLATQKSYAEYHTILNAENAAENYLTDGNNRTAILDGGTTKNARNMLEAAIYAFANESDFNVSDKNIANAIWNFENIFGDSVAGNQSDPLWNASKAFVDWAAGDGECNKIINNKICDYKGEYATENQPNLRTNSSDAKINFVYKDACYVAGPFKITYDSGAVYGNIRFTKDFKVNVTKTNSNGTTAKLSTVKIVDASRNELNSVPNGDAFYLEIPYEGNEDLASITIDASVKYISKIKGTQTTRKSTVYAWKYDVTDKNIVECTTTHYHDPNCTVKPSGLPVSEYGFYMEDISNSDWVWVTCCNWTAGKSGFTKFFIKAEVKAQLKRIGTYNDVLQNMRTFSGELEWSTAKKSFTVEFEQATMKIAGNVWEDTKTGKDSTFNGSLDTADIMLEGIEVRLYEPDGTLARVGNTNPTLTDKNGYYEFTEVNPTKKYFVRFTYDGMIYTNTYRTETNELTYNTDAWNALSKGSEIVSDRAAFNTQFVTVGSYPMGYKPSKAIFTDMTYLIDGYNEVYSIDDADVLAYKAKITEQLQTYLKTNNRLLNENYIKTIYQPILDSITDNNEKVKARRILQYIWDCRIHSYAGYESVRDGKTNKADELYPYYDKIILIDDEGNMVTSNTEENINGFWVIYNGQLNVNQGIVRREQTDLSMLEDLYKTVVSINGKDETYKYGSLDKKDVEVSSSDIQSYTQNIAKTDYNYKTSSATLSSDLSQTSEYPEGYAPIQLYITYRIKVTNNKSTPTSVNEVVTYINTNYYSYSDEYTTTQGNTLYGVQAGFITNNEEKNLADYGAEIKTNTVSIYGAKSQTETNLGADLYISFNDKNIILNNQDSLVLYVTYRLGENSTKDAKYNCTYNEANRGNSAQVILQDTLVDDKQLRLGTQAEVNAFSTYYSKSADVRSTQAKYTNYYTHTSVTDPYAKYRAAGVLDYNSMPGNLTLEEIQTKTEDDWDNASVLVIKAADVRKILGNVWEVTKIEDGVEKYTESHWANETDYPIFDASKVVGESDITVELIELKDGKEYVRARTNTGSDGSYILDGYIPGDYTVRFIYGDKAQYDTVQYSDYSTFTTNGISVKRPYNGLFYQSTKANPKTNENPFWYAGEEADNTRYSDAYDETNIRLKLTSSKQEYTYGDVIDVLREPSKYLGYAYTSMLEIYPEKAKTETTAQNPAYEISNIDFGLTPRTLANLNIKKEVTHLKLILANGIVQFDADTATIREQGVPAVLQAGQGDDINISMSSELINGATLEITYAITVTNNTASDKVKYYKDSSNNVIAIGLYNEEAEKLVTFEDAIRVYKDNIANFERLSDGDAATFDPWVSKIEAGTTELVQLDKNKTEEFVAKTKPLAVADFVSKNLNFIKVNYDGREVNTGWDLYSGPVDNSIWGQLDGTKEDFEEKYYKQTVSNNPPNLGHMTGQAQEIYDNTIVIANEKNPLITTDLAPGESVSTEIVLSKVISVNSDSTDNKSYENRTRILKIYSEDSRLQDMKGAKSEKVIISDPTGIGNKYVIIALALVVFVIIGLGVIFIKKFVMSRR